MPSSALVLALAALLAPFGLVASLRAAQIEFVTAQLPWAAANKGYAPPPLEVRTSGTCPVSGIGYRIASGELPSGLQLSALGYVSGIPQHVGSFEFSVRVADGCSSTVKKFTLVVAQPPVLTVTPVHLEFRRAGEEKSSEIEPAEDQTLHVSSTWPGLSYQITLANTLPNGGDADPPSTEIRWLSATPERGVTSQDLIPSPTPPVVAQPGNAPPSPAPPDTAVRATPAPDVPPAFEDRVRVRVDARTLKPGHYSANMTISAWQALAAPVVVVDLVVGEKKDVAK